PVLIPAAVGSTRYVLKGATHLFSGASHVSGLVAAFATSRKCRVESFDCVTGSGAVRSDLRRIARKPLSFRFVAPLATFRCIFCALEQSIGSKKIPFD